VCLLLGQRSGSTVSHHILLVEDSHGTCELFAEALAVHRFDEVLHIEHGVESGWEFLSREYTSPPTLILLDLKLRNSSGLALLRRVRADARLGLAPIVILTTSDDTSDTAEAYANGANGYVVKPGVFTELVRLTGDLCRFWLGWNRLPS